MEYPIFYVLLFFIFLAIAIGVLLSRGIRQRQRRAGGFPPRDGSRGSYPP